MHSSDIGLALLAEIDDWRKNAHPRGEPTIADDRLSWHLVLRLATPPPLVRWGLLFGDAIHNMRCVLDNLAWQLASIHGQPAKPTEVYFPIVMTRKAWKKDRATKWLDAAVADRLERVQPFLQHGPGGTADSDPLAWLRRFDNDHKHQVPTIAVLAQNAANHSAAVQFEDEAAAAAEGAPRVQIEGGPLTDGATMVRAETSHPIVKVTGAFTVDLMVAVETTSGYVGLTQVAQQLGAHVTSLTASFLDLL